MEILNDILYQFIEDMRVLLIQQEQQHGQLKFLSSRAMKNISHFINKMLKMIIAVMKNNQKLGIYNIKIFIEDSCNFETRHNISTFAKCYNFLLLNTNFFSQYLLRKDMIFGHIVGKWPTLSPYLFIQVIHQ